MYHANEKISFKTFFLCNSNAMIRKIPDKFSVERDFTTKNHLNNTFSTCKINTLNMKKKITCL